jgi:hypothetical protein
MPIVLLSKNSHEQIFIAKHNYRPLTLTWNVQYSLCNEKMFFEENKDYMHFGPSQLFKASD